MKRPAYQSTGQVTVRLHTLVCLAGFSIPSQIGVPKTIINQRFTFPGEQGGNVEVDVECLNRFVFICEMNVEGDWHATYDKVSCEKNCIVLVDPRSIPKFDDAVLATCPYECRYLGYYQSLIGHSVLKKLLIGEGEKSRMNAAMRACRAWASEKARRTRMDALLRVLRE
ncbi:hypothetical protein JCM10449v2_000045 [Rhodotorula kratochvilovae]